MVIAVPGPARILPYRTISVRDLPAGHWSLTRSAHLHGMARDL